MSTDKESSAAGTDNRPPMLVESDYESWKIRIERYIRGKTLGEDVVQVTRDKRDEEFTKIENNKELADIQATNILNKGSPRQRRAPGNVGNTGNQGTQNNGQMMDNVGKKVICYNCRREGHVSRQCKEKKRVKYSQYFKDKMLLMEAKEKGTFEVSHEDAYDSDVDEGPHVAAAFMANLSSISGTNSATTSQVNEVHTDANQIFDNVNHLLTHEMHQEEHLDSDVESDIDDNTIPYHQYQLDSEVQDVPTDLVNDSLRAELARCKQEMVSLERSKVKHDLDQTIIQRSKRNAELEEENDVAKVKNFPQTFCQLTPP
ncbi:integrase, catalytic region, zinc finger, CCHC-type containing protein [Tanacetum coccineum]